jgi:hypothetical protein
MAFFQSFFDESGKFKDHNVIAFCGFGSSPSGLVEFDKQWNRQLRRTGMRALHMVNAQRINKSLSPTISPQTLKDRINELKPFADCINDYLELGIACVFEVEGYTAFPFQSKQLMGGSSNPFYVQFLRTMLMLVEYVKPGDLIGIMCDEDEETAWNCYALYRRVKKIESRAKRSLIAVTFANDEHFPALQAADMLSFLCRKEANRLFYGTPYDFFPLFRYLTNPRGTSAINWRVAFKDKAALEPLGKSLANLHTSKKQKGPTSGKKGTK